MIFMIKKVGRIIRKCESHSYLLKTTKIEVYLKIIIFILFWKTQIMDNLRHRDLKLLQYNN